MQRYNPSFPFYSGALHSIEYPRRAFETAATSYTGTKAYVKPVSNIIFSDKVAIYGPSLNFIPLYSTDHDFSSLGNYIHFMSLSYKPSLAYCYRSKPPIVNDPSPLIGR